MAEAEVIETYYPKAAETQPQVFDKLKSLWQRNRLPTALLFTGKPGVGKWLVARELAQLITCHNQDEAPCGKCVSCRQALSYSHPDIFYLFPLPLKDWEELVYPYLQQKHQDPFGPGSGDVTSLTSIDSIRRFSTRLSQRSSLSEFKVGIINEAERMMPGTMDSLLKLLEEPPPAAHLILITPEPIFLPLTIQSRVRQIRFPNIAVERVQAYLQRRHGIDEETAAVLSRETGGTLYQLQSLIEGEHLQRRDTAFKLISEAWRGDPVEFQNKYSSAPAIQDRDLVEQLIEFWQVFIRDVAVLSVSDQTEADSGLEDQLVHVDLLPEYEKLIGRRSSLAFLEAQNERLERIKIELRRNVNPRMAALSFLVELAGSKAAG
jgi:DNA polymerase-3 subunit delta'